MTHEIYCPLSTLFMICVLSCHTDRVYHQLTLIGSLARLVKYTMAGDALYFEPFFDIYIYTYMYTYVEPFPKSIVLFLSLLLLLLSSI